MLARNDRGTGGVPRALKAAFVVHFMLGVVSAAFNGLWIFRRLRLPHAADSAAQR